MREVYDVSYPRLVVQLFALTGDLADAEDAVQEAFVKALGKGGGFEQVDNPEAWLRTVALNHVRNRWRHAEVVRRLRTKVPGPTPGGGGWPRACCSGRGARRARSRHTAPSSCSTTSPTDRSPTSRLNSGSPKELSSRVWRAVENCSRRCCPTLSCPSLSCPSLGRRIMSSFGPDLQVLREVGNLVRQPAFDELVEVRGRRTRRARFATASALAVATVGGGRPRCSPRASTRNPSRSRSR